MKTSVSSHPSHLCLAHLKFLLLALQVGFEGLDVAEMGAALLVIVFLVMLALHHLLVSPTEVLLQESKRTNTQRITTCTTHIYLRMVAPMLRLCRE